MAFPCEVAVAVVAIVAVIFGAVVDGIFAGDDVDTVEVVPVVVAVPFAATEMFGPAIVGTFLASVVFVADLGVVPAVVDGAEVGLDLSLELEEEVVSVLFSFLDTFCSIVVFIESFTGAIMVGFPTTGVAADVADTFCSIVVFVDSFADADIVADPVVVGAVDVVADVAEACN